jgi:hypothetical protein
MRRRARTPRAIGLGRLGGLPVWGQTVTGVTAVTRERVAPEVSAARREAGLKSHPITAVLQTEFTGLSLVSLVEQMDSASRVDILGVLPRVLGEALLTGNGTTENRARSADDFTYMTPSRERVLAYRHENVMGRVIQRWVAGLTCFRNWTEKQRARNAGEPENVYLIDDLFLECIVVCHRPDQEAKVYALNLLPQVESAGQPGTTPHESLVITAVADATVERVLSRIADLRGQATPLVARGLICKNGRDRGPNDRDAIGGLPAEFVPVLVDLRPYGTRPAYAVGPVAVVALYAESARGPGLLLKHRTNSNSRNDFGTLSLLSERVMEEDLALAVSHGVPAGTAEGDVLDHWWKTLDKPTRIEVPLEAFVAAGQREVFAAAGLDIASDRFAYCGSILLEREGTDEFLGFFGFRVHLRRDHEIDEFVRARNWNVDLQFVLAADLYGRDAPGANEPDGRPPLNRLLSRRPDWVSSALLAEPAPATRAEHDDDS